MWCGAGRPNPHKENRRGAAGGRYGSSGNKQAHTVCAHTASQSVLTHYFLSDTRLQAPEHFSDKVSLLCTEPKSKTSCPRPSTNSCDGIFFFEEALGGCACTCTHIRTHSQVSLRAEHLFTQQTPQNTQQTQVSVRTGDTYRTSATPLDGHGNLGRSPRGRVGGSGRQGRTLCGDGHAGGSGGEGGWSPYRAMKNPLCHSRPWCFQQVPGDAPARTLPLALSQ